MRAIVKRVAVGAAAVTLAGCGTAPGILAEGPAATPSVHPRWSSCAAEMPQPSAEDGLDALELPRLGDDFAPSAVIVCGVQVQRRADGGQDLVATEGRADDVTALVAALRLPDEQVTDGACTADLPMVPWFALLDEQGRWVRPGVPRDSCGKVRVEVRDAVAGSRLTQVASRVLREIESAEAAASGCSQQWADMVAVETTQVSQARPAAGADPFPAGQRVRLCVYRVPPSEQGSGKPAGDLEHGVVLTPERQARIEKALLAAAPAVTCSTPANRFALLLAANGAGAAVYVELDGCQRILIEPATGGPVLAQGDAALTALLDHP
jgi:hypothetical protein